MKVALVVYQFDETKGGVEAYVANFSRQLLAHGHEAHVYCAKRSGEAPEGLTFHDVPVTRFWSPLAVRSFAENSARMLKEESYDVIHGFSRTYFQDIYRIGGGCHAEYLRQTHAWARTVAGRMFIALNPRHRAIMALERKRFDRKNYKRLTAISELTKREIAREFGVPPEDITVIYNAVDAGRFSAERLGPMRGKMREKLGVRDDEAAILFVGTGWERKGLRYLIEAMKRIEDAKTKLIVVGEGDVKAYQKMAGRIGVGGRVVFAGHSARVEECYAAADMFAFPSLHDAFGTAALEAMASGLGVACSRLAGASEIISDGADGLLVDEPRDAGALARQIGVLLNPAKRKEMGEKARVTAGKYSYAENYRRTMQVYDEVVRMKSSGGRT